MAQILVVVASTYVRYIWAEEEKGFIRTVVGYELIDPKRIYQRIFKYYIYCWSFEICDDIICSEREYS